MERGVTYFNAVLFFFFNETAPTVIYTLSLHDALPICFDRSCVPGNRRPPGPARRGAERVLGAEGGLHRGDLRSPHRGGGSPRRAGRALGTPPPVRRNRRGHRAEAVRRARGAAAPTVVRRGDAGGTGGRKYAGCGDATTGSRSGPPATGRPSTGDGRVRARLGDRYRT